MNEIIEQITNPYFIFGFVLGSVIIALLKRYWKKREKKIDYDPSILLKSRYCGDGKYEVGGVVFYADSHAEAIRKYRRGVK